MRRFRACGRDASPTAPVLGSALDEKQHFRIAWEAQAEPSTPRLSLLAQAPVRGRRR